jgi:4-hydroxybenzoate polyprenyltransferase
MGGSPRPPGRPAGDLPLEAPARVAARYAAPTGAASVPASLLAHVRCIRYADVLVLQGSPVFGTLYALPDVTVDVALRLGVFLFASCLLVAHVFSLNDWAGIAADGRDPNKAATVFVTRGVTRRSIGIMSLVLLAASLGVFATLGGTTLMLALAIAALGVAYSHPALNAKGIPVASSMPHVLGGLLHFLLGYSLFQAPDARGVLIAVYFALTFAAGHLNQEVRDHEGDRLNGIRTNAVRFGPRQVFLASFLVFTLAYAHLAVLAATGWVPAGQALVVLLYPLHAAWSLAAWRSGLTFAAVSRLSSRYRRLYAVIGLVILSTLLLA